MMWPYLLSPALDIRKIVAAHYLFGQRVIVEVGGGFGTSLIRFLRHDYDRYVCVDPYRNPDSDELASERNIFVESRFGPGIGEISGMTGHAAVLLGFDLERSDELVSFLSRSSLAIVEKPLDWKANLVADIVSDVGRPVAHDFVIDLSRSSLGNIDTKNTQYPPRLVRHMLIF